MFHFLYDEAIQIQEVEEISWVVRVVVIRRYFFVLPRYLRLFQIGRQAPNIAITSVQKLQVLTQPTEVGAADGRGATNGLGEL